ncbi:hypothetical protein [Chloroherpeton thalassium]|uniref:hypothetical protein n=1 Tax=Chloroherpeton thalassium TaxID=100716 RepID=UPI00031A17F4|nr:hypothetical protein [Chloroherpeton thalassium]
MKMNGQLAVPWLNSTDAASCGALNENIIDCKIECEKHPKNLEIEHPLLPA